MLKNVSRENTNAKEVTSRGIAAGLHFDDVPLASRSRQNSLCDCPHSVRTSSGTPPRITLQTLLPNTLCRHNSKSMDSHSWRLRGFTATPHSELPVNTLKCVPTAQGKSCFIRLRSWSVGQSDLGGVHEASIHIADLRFHKIFCF